MRRYTFAVVASLGIAYTTAPLCGQTITVKSPLEGLVTMGNRAFNVTPGALPDNSMAEINAHPGIYSAAVINLLWSQLEPQQGVFDDSALVAALGNIATYNLKYPATPVAAKLRISAGIGTPGWAMQLTGGPINIKATTGGTIQIGAFWKPVYIAAWRALQAHLAAEYDFSAQIAEVAISSCSSVTAEPFVVSVDQPSIDNMRAFGFSDTAYMACLSGAIDDYAVWVNTPLDFTFYQLYETDACPAGSATGCITANTAFPIQVMDAFRAALGVARGVVAQHGLQDPIVSATLPLFTEFQNLYNQAQSTLPATNSPLELQTYSPTVDWDSAVTLGLMYHPTEIEVWDTTAVGGEGQAPLSATQLQGYSSSVKSIVTSLPAAALVSSATQQVGPVASGSLVTIYGGGLAANGAATVSVTDSAGSTQQATTVFASPNQVNAVIPTNMAAGVASFSVTPPGGNAVNGKFQVASVAPGIFSANATSSGVAAAEVITVQPDGTQTTSLAFQCSPAPCVPKPINVSAPGTTVYLVLFGTGIRNRSALQNTSVSFGANGSETVVPAFGGAQNQFSGLDQINVAIPSSMAGAGTLYVTFTADQASSKAVTIQIQ